jgi:hypothetical protein
VLSLLLVVAYRTLYEREEQLWLELQYAALCCSSQRWYTTLAIFFSDNRGTNVMFR